MAVFSLGSVNGDHFYQLPHIPQPGETVVATGLERGLGGKGTNVAVAACRAGSAVTMIGAVGQDGAWAIERLTSYGVDTRHIATVDAPTGHAIIAVDPQGENAITVFPGANHAIPEHSVHEALAEASPGDTLFLQNEVSQQVLAARLGHESGLKVAYLAAPFDFDAVQAVLPYLDMLIVNAVEAGQLEQATGHALTSLPVAHVIMTLGSEGCRWVDTANGRSQDFPAVPVTPVDTTGAGDTFAGFMLAALDQGQSMEQAIGLAQRAAALKVTRHGTADVIPNLLEVREAGLPQA